ncbi:MAG: SWIM zinc finger family protein [Rhodomicrobium sp.]
MKAGKPKCTGKTGFRVDALRELAGGKVFARGEDYFSDGLVQILAIEPRRVLALVAGTEDYTVVLTGHGEAIDGECSCPAFADWGFCKHMVATALAANAAGGDAEAEGAGALLRIRDYLEAKGADALAGMIVEMAERDPALFRKLDMAAAATHADDKTLEARLRKAIDGATRTVGYVGYREAAGWAAEVDAALDAVAGLAPARAGLAMKLAERAIERIEEAVEGIDDSDGHCGALLHRARDIHLDAARAARPEPMQLARNLFAREMEDEYDTFHGAAALYAEVLGEQGLAEYRRLATEAWDSLPPRVGETGLEHSGNYGRLTDILDFFAERDGDTDARIALRAKDLSSPWCYFGLAQFCLSQAREEEALRWAEEGLWIFEDGRLDERLLFLAVELLSKAGRKADAEAHLWRAFEKAPGLELCKRLGKLGGKAARERAVKFLEGRLTNEQRTRWYCPADLLVRVLMEEKRFDAAWAAVRQHGASIGVRETLAMASEKAHPREALEVYAERVGQLADSGGNPAYEEAAQLVARMATLRSKAEQAAYVAELKTRFGRKRNFMKLLG